MDGAVGFCVHSGWATAVLLVGPVTAPEIADSRTVPLSDPAVPESSRPYHAGLSLPKAEAARTVARLVRAVEQFARRSLLELFKAYRTGGHRLRGAVIVVGSNPDPALIENEASRADAQEGRLFRVVVQEAAQSRGLALSVTETADKDLYVAASKKLGIPEARLKEKLVDFGREVEGPWQEEQQAAALAAWVGLLRRR